MWWVGAYSKEEEQRADELSTEPALITAFQYKKIMETTAYETQKLNAKIYTVNYEDFVAEPVAFIKKMMEHLALPPSPLVDKFMERITVNNRNNRAVSKTQFSEETKKKIMEIVSA